VGAIDLLRQQHREVEELFEKLRAADRRGKVGMIGKLAEDLTVHTQLEERFVYPLAERNPELAQKIAHSRREHDDVKRLLSDLMDLKQKDPRIDTILAQIEQSVRHHVSEEEREVFPKLEADAAAMQQLGEQMKATQEQLKKEELLEEQV
jgi:hemerythrin superfamily protein